MTLENVVLVVYKIRKKKNGRFLGTAVIKNVTAHAVNEKFIDWKFPERFKAGYEFTVKELEIEQVPCKDTNGRLTGDKIWNMVHVVE